MLSQRTKEITQRIGIVLALFGLFCLCQPFSFSLYNHGFQILGVGTLIFIFVGFIPVGASIKKAILILAIISAVVVGFAVLSIGLAPLLIIR